MKPSPLLLAANAVLAVVGVAPAKADDLALSFDLPEINHPEPSAPVAAAETVVPAANVPQPLPIPAGAGSPPMRYHSPQQLPSKVYRQAVAVALDQGATPAAILPPAPPQFAAAPVVIAAEPPPEPAAPTSPDSELRDTSADFVLSFELAPLPSVMVAEASPDPTALLLSLFEGDTDSLVARAVGSAEGTRTASGGITAAYFGHTDPGNQVWNMGTFSYQHGATSAAEADQKQLQRLKSQSEVLRKRALNHGLTLTLEETLNGIDLANQSPLAAIGRVGYVERLAEAKLEKGLTGTDAIIVARTRSYINPDTERWNAPGLGNTEASITRDQRRRVQAIAGAVEVYSQQQPTFDPSIWSLGPTSDLSTAPATLAEPTSEPQAPADIIFQVWTDGSEAGSEPSLATEPVEKTEQQAAGDLLSEAVDRMLGSTLEAQEASSVASPTWATVREGNQVAPPPVAEVQAANLETPTLETEREADQNAPVATTAEAQADSPETPALETVREANQVAPLAPADEQAGNPENGDSQNANTTPEPQLAESPQIPKAESSVEAASQAQSSDPEKETAEPAMSDPNRVPGAVPEVILHFPSSPALSEATFADEPFVQIASELVVDPDSSIQDEAKLPVEEGEEPASLELKTRIPKRQLP